MAFENLIGNANVKQILENTIQENHILHSYLFSGIEGIGKTLFAKEFAQAILCMNSQQTKPCQTCKSCLEFLGNSHPDFMIIDTDDGKSIKIEQVRFLQGKIAEKPVSSNKKVYILNHSELMTREAANSLLKTLEEPPEYAVLILITANESKLLTTIKSRCMKIAFQKIEESAIAEYLKNQGMMDVTDNMLRYSQGSIQRAIKLQEDKEEYLALETLVKNIKQMDITQLWNHAEIVYKAKENIFDYLDYLTNVFYEKLKQSNQIAYANAIQIVQTTKQRLLANANYDMSIDSLLLKIWEEIH